MCFERVSIPCIVGDTLRGQVYVTIRSGVIFGKVQIRVESGMKLTKGIGSGFERVITPREIL